MDFTMGDLVVAWLSPSLLNSYSGFLCRVTFISIQNILLLRYITFFEMLYLRKNTVLQH